VQAGPHAASRIAPQAAPPRRQLFRRPPEVARDCLLLSNPAGWTHAVSLKAGLDHTSATIPWPQTTVRRLISTSDRHRGQPSNDGGQALHAPGPRKATAMTVALQDAPQGRSHSVATPSAPSPSRLFPQLANVAFAARSDSPPSRLLDAWSSSQAQAPIMSADVAQVAPLLLPEGAAQGSLRRPPTMQVHKRDPFHAG